MTKQETIKAVEAIGGTVSREVIIESAPVNKGMTLLPCSSFSVEYKGQNHELILYYDKAETVHKTTVKGTFGEEIKKMAQLP